MSKKVNDMWQRMKRHFQVRSSEWFNAVMVAAWGVYVTLTPGMFEKLGPSTSGMTTIAPQHIWGFVALIVGMTRLCALFINGQWSVTPIVRIVTSFLTMFVWFCVVIGIARSAVQGMGIVIYSGLIIIDGYGAYRAAEDAAQVSGLAKFKRETEVKEHASSNITTFRLRK